MGSEGPVAVAVQVTGFKKFHGVAENPTETIVGKLESYLKSRGSPPGVRIGSCTVLDTAGDGALPVLVKLLDSALSGDDQTIDTPESQMPGYHSAPGERIIWIHLGVNSGANKFAIERRAINEATFRCPDEFGWQPQHLPIIAEDGDCSLTRETSLPVAGIVEKLLKRGYDVVLSDDAGRFVCNYVYYHSLHHASLHGTCSLFVHVPLFSKIKEETQMEFVEALLDVLATTI